MSTESVYLVSIALDVFTREEVAFKVRFETDYFRYSLTTCIVLDKGLAAYDVLKLETLGLAGIG